MAQIVGDEIVGFNPRTCVRCENIDNTTQNKTACFNPRTCVRCETPYECLKPWDDVSIHAPA